MDAVKNNETNKKGRQKFNLRKLRLSLKYRPEILKKILKMRLCLRKKDRLINNMQLELKTMEKKLKEKELKDVFTQTDCNDKKDSKHVCIQTEDNKKKETNSKDSEYEKSNGDIGEEKKDLGWEISKGDKETVSIADQVKEVAQSALQQTGMVYVESAGMYYDYKTGYYYNSELGLYYHTDTGCYYYYSDEKQSFVFHSYPDRSQEIENKALIAHEKRKAKKHKKGWKTEDDIDNLTKNLSQDKEEDGKSTKPKRRKLHKKKEVSEKATNSKGKQETQEVSMETDKIDTKAPEANGKENDEPEKNKELTNDAEKSESNVLSETVSATVEVEDLEDGECSETESEHSDIEQESSCGNTSTASDDDESIARHHPPCMRIIVKETTLPKLKVGNLFLITKDGGSIGREGEHHCIVLRDQNVSRNHLNITYDMAKRSYLAMDLGSKNGTILNGTRMSESQTVSKSLEVIHGSTLEIGETKLLCHIHPGTDTCGHCEPGLIMETSEEKKVAYTRTCSVQKQHQLELARLKNKYAPKPLAIEATEYNDRAQQRRDKVGSSHHSEKTQSSDLDTFIAPENKGFKLLEKMGWSKGEGLGKDNQGETEPIPLISNDGKAGLGTGGAAAPDPFPITKTPNKLGSATLKLASLTKMLQPPAKAFQNTDDDDDDED